MAFRTTGRYRLDYTLDTVSPPAWVKHLARFDSAEDAEKLARDMAASWDRFRGWRVIDTHRDVVVKQGETASP